MGKVTTPSNADASKANGVPQSEPGGLAKKAIGGTVTRPKTADASKTSRFPRADAGDLAWTVVYLDTEPRFVSKGGSNQVSIRLSANGFAPYHQCVKRGDEVVVVADSKTGVHGFHFFSKADKSLQGIKGPPLANLGQSVSQVFRKPDALVAVACTVHPSEAAYVTVVASDFHSMCHADGSFEIVGDLPSPGEQAESGVSPWPGDAWPVARLQIEDSRLKIDGLILGSRNRRRTLSHPGVAAGLRRAARRDTAGLRRAAPLSFS
jgi:hypothetical protein